MGLTQSSPFTEQEFALPDDFLIESCHHFDIRTLVNIAAVNHRLRMIIKLIIQARAHGPIANIITYRHIKSFMSTLTNTRSAIGGSIAQAIITPSIFNHHPTTNLNVFTPAGGLADWEYYLNNIGFIYSADTRQPDANSRRTVTFYFHTRGKGSKDAVVVCEARTGSCLTPILSSQYTCQMNFFTADHIYCAHPHFTPQLKTLHVNRKVLNNRDKAERKQLLDRGVTIITKKDEKTYCDANILCRSILRIVGSKPLRLLSQWPGDKIGIFSWKKDKEEFLHSRRVPFWLGGDCDSENCLNTNLDEDDE